MTRETPLSITRRSALKTTAGVLAAPLILPSSWFGRGAPSETIRLGAIGTGRMGRGDMRGVLRAGLDPAINARIVAVCDVDSVRAEQAKEFVAKEYAERLNGGKAPDVAVHSDFRELLARDDIDGVTISTPDFWHAYMAIAAAEAGKDIYVQKPLAYTIPEGRALVDAVRKHGVVLQVGSQQRSHRAFRRACELVRNGKIGALKRIHVRLPEDKGQGDPKRMKPPANLRYDMWMGPTAEMPYTEDRVHPQSGYGRPGWLQIQRYTLGMITGWGSHMNDTAQWGHGDDREAGLVEIEAEAEFPKRGLFDVHTTFRAEGRYADGVVLVQETGPAGVRFEGEDGSVYVKRWSVESEPGEILDAEIPEDGVHLKVSDDHYRDFLECMRTREDPVAPVEAGHRSNSICVITHIAMKLTGKLRWDPERERFTDSAKANAMLDYQHRKPWTV